MKKLSYKKGWAFVLMLAMAVTTLFGGFGSLGISGVVGEVYASPDPSIRTTTLDLTTGAGITIDELTDEGWAWDGTTTPMILTLSGINLSTASSNGIELPENSSIIIYVNDDNSVECGNGDVGTYHRYGIKTRGDLTIAGSGTLTVTAGAVSGVGYESIGVRQSSTTGKIIISGAGLTLNIYGGSSDTSESYGISAESSVIINSGTVNVFTGAGSSNSAAIFGKLECGAGVMITHPAGAGISDNGMFIATTPGGTTRVTSATIAYVDTVPPTAGSGGTITSGAITANTAALSWTAGTDNVTAPGNLQYKVVYSTSNNIDTLTNANANGIVALNWTANTTGYTVTGLTPSTNYYFNTIIRDEVGNMAVYTTTSLVTAVPTQAVPTATVQNITGTTRVGQTLTGHYTYSDVNGDLEGTSTLKWYRSDDTIGTNKAAIATANTYVLQAADLGKYISFEVTPIAATGTTTGVAVESARTVAIIAATPGSSSGGSSGGSGSTATPIIKTNTGSVTGNQLKNAAGVAKDGGTVTINSNKTNEVTFPTSGLDSLSGKNNSLTVVTDNGTLIFNSKAVAAMGTQAAATDIKVIVDDVVKSTLTEEQQTKVANKTVYDLSVMSGGKLISSFNGGKVNVSIPYELKEDETADNVTVWYMADNGSLTEINCTYDAKSKSVTFVVDHFSKYIIGYDDLADWVNPFTDVKSSAWYYNAAAFVNVNGLMKGQTDTTFGPQGAMTRSMFVTILGRMEGADATTYANKNTFSDVKSNQYYAPYIAWASDKGIVTGMGGDQFAPNAAVTREQMAVMMTNYIKFKGQGPTGAWAIQLTYGDLDKVSSWANEGVMFMTMKDLMKGMGKDEKGNTLFDPKATSTRAQTAQVMMNLEELLK